jgi:acetoin utilization deacetylase AcuC-like enzyme
LPNYNDGMTLFYTDQYMLPLPEGHRFPMRKYALLRQRVEMEGLAAKGFEDPPEATRNQLLRAHGLDYVHRATEGLLGEAEVRRLGFPWSRQMIERSLRSSGATVEACKAALDHGVGINLAGGTHHAFRHAAEGYCVFNDSAIAALELVETGLARRVLIVDLDVHQGNGTASILAGNPDVFTLSVHGAKNFPLRKEASDLDVALADGTTDAPYLAELDRALGESFERSSPDFLIYVSGADPFKDDTLGRLALSMDGLVERDRLVFERAARAGLPVAVSMAGGYARQVSDTVEIHLNTVRQAMQMLWR